VPSEINARPLSRGYTRDEKVEREIAVLLSLPHFERQQRILARSGSQICPLPETALHLIRMFLISGEVELAWSAAENLAQRLAPRITRRIAIWKSLTPTEKEEVEETLLDRLYRAWMSLAPENEFWEVRFYVSIDRLLADVIDRIIRRKSHELNLDTQADSDMDPWESIADKQAMSPEGSAIIADALASLPEPLRTAFWLKFREDWTEEEIAAHLALSSRTIRNYLRRAKELLAIWRGDLEENE
jgi:RNA polymerase sigma factor (sigma-70 family)